MALREPHELPDQSVAGLYRADKNKHVKEQFTDILPGYGHSREPRTAKGGFAGSHHRENNTGQHDHAALQAQGCVCFQKGLADIRRRLPREGCKWDRRNGGGHEYLEEPTVDRQDHDQRQYPDEQAAQKRYDPQGNALPEAHIGYCRDHFLRKLRGHGRHDPGRGHDGGDRPLRNAERCQQDVHAEGDGRFSQCKANKDLEGVFRSFQFRKGSGRFHDAHYKEQHQKAVAYGFQCAIDVHHDIPHSPALELIGALAHERPDLRELAVPHGEGIAQILNDPVSISHYLTSMLGKDREGSASRRNGLLWNISAGDEREDLLGKGDHNAACHGEHAIGPLRRIVAFEGKAKLQDAEAQQDNSHGPD